jgi:23S rRNA pseudouridine2605 synthase
VKIHAFIGQNSEYSRRKAEDMVKKGKVFVNGVKAHIGQRVGVNDRVQVEGKYVLAVGKKITYLVYKPVGMVSTVSDNLGRGSVVGLVPKSEMRIYPVGRLDKDSRGLMLLTNDGNLAQKYSHPRYGIEKVYKVTLDRWMPGSIIDKLIGGVDLSDGVAKPDDVVVLENNSRKCVLKITLHEGRNREIRRMMGKLGYTVVDLERVQIGNYKVSDLKGKSFVEV